MAYLVEFQGVKKNDEKFSGEVKSKSRKIDWIKNLIRLKYKMDFDGVKEINFNLKKYGR